MKVLILNGPNLNLLGMREPEVYGTRTLEELMAEVICYGREHGVEVETIQANGEGTLIDVLQKADAYYDGIVFNPAAYTHYSYALRDAIASIAMPVVEVHLSDINTREEFRKVSVTAPVCLAQHAGGGVASYLRGIDTLVAHLAGDTNVSESR